ncbi:MAG: hypothetical protein ACI9BW_004056 [Gammaproteobacteria bacterium]|jgi:hypothetical protein
MFIIFLGSSAARRLSDLGVRHQGTSGLSYFQSTSTGLIVILFNEKVH